MRQYLRYLSLFCCSLLLVLFFGQVNGYTLAQKVSPEDATSVTAIAFSQDGKNVAAGFRDGRVLVFDPETGKEKKALPGHLNTPVTGVAFNPLSNNLASVGRDSVARVWKPDTGEQTNLLQAHENPPRTIAASQDGRIWVTGAEDTRVDVWDIQTGKLQQIFEGHTGFVNSVAVSPDGKTVASGSDDTTIILWNLETGKKRKVLLGHTNGVTSVAFSPNGTLLASASNDGTVRLWDVNSGTVDRVLRGPTKRIRTVAFNLSGTVVAGGGDENNIFLWSLPSGTPLGTLRGNKSIAGIAFNPVDSDTLVSGDNAGEIVLWDTLRGQQKKIIQVPPKGQGQKNQQKIQKIQKSQALINSDRLSSLNKTLLASVPSPPGGPILIVTSGSNPFGNYYAEILRTEGLNSFNVSDISAVSATTLANYDVVILTDLSLSSQQVTIFTNWVNGGGNLIAMRPDKQLASLLGLTDTGSTLSNGYLLADTSKPAANGIINQTIQFHGTADRYTLNGATGIATLYTNATTATTNPAVSLRSVGSNGGQAAAFTYDLARSVVYTRQGNPAWAGQERDGFSPIRSDDLFFGDSQPDWVDLNKVAIPQADEQQRLLANLIITMNLSKKPLPRFWYFPNGKKAVVLMTGDDHGNGGTGPRFDQFNASSPAGCSVDNWECIRGTSYVYPTPGMPLTNTQAAAYDAQGFEISLHVNTNCSDFTPASLQTFYTQQLNDFANKYPSLPAPSTQRHHCLVWSDWSSTPEVELNKGIRLNTTYYYWPPSWILDRPGFFTGSGMPMRLAKQDGTTIDVYEANTQMTDESGQSYPYTIDTLLDRALGSEGYYGVFNVNAHTDTANSSISDAVVNSAKTRSVPVVSAQQLLTWLDARGNSSFGSLVWNNGTLNFTITKGTGANGLQAMLPNQVGGAPLSSITRNGTPVNFTTETIKGIVYARFAGETGSYVATYAADTVPPTVTSTSPNNNAINVAIGTNVTATFSEAIAPTTINTNTFELRNSANALVSATVTYNEANRTATLIPTTSLAANTTYTATLKGGTTDPRIKDLAGNALATSYTWSFTTGSLPCPSEQPCSIWNNSATPSNPSEADSSAIEIGVKFRSDFNGYITGIRFYKGSGNTGTHVGTLWSSTGQQLARATFSNETSSGWQQVNFSTPVAITANTVYVASYHTNVGRYAADKNFFASSGVDNPPLYALRNGVSGANGLYSYGSNPIFPTSSYQSSNYWVDVVFATNITPDTTPPTVTGSTPVNGTTGVNPSTSVTATFSEPIDIATINTNTFELRNASNTLIPASVTYDAGTRTATLTPTSPLATSTTYTATLRGGSTDPRVKDVSGNALAQNYTWSFTTSNTSFVTIWSNSATPSTVNTNDSSAVELGVKFRSSQNGYIKGLRFYKGSQNTGTHVGTLWSNSGQQLGRATFANETASGWQEVYFTTPVAIAANTVYVASYHTNVGFYSKNENYFTNSGVSNSPLYALRNGESGSNGIYRYSATPVFPTSTYQSSNYWVDVIFSTTP
ncbi:MULTISPECIES: DUF4082 domain-containing protein [Nostocales]|uniref:DUF4082 domain-containing protein n=3 Tax=Nostocales TaxID=1161 RepID=A0A0C1NAN7_9CYAN|nr:DUF4082 domain-containing protein [Tolypothrix bouteillei]KAF3884583.1 DUF4082 domain-containing protein [Tolypothrix bouteillei VB521301]